jgi:hypothetical protein
VLSRPLHGDEQHGPGDGGFQAWVTGVTAASSLKQRYVRMHACAGTHLSSAMPVANPTSWHLFLLGQRIPPVLLANRLDRAMEHRAAQKPRLEAREVRRAIWLRLLSRATSSAACAILCAADSCLSVLVRAGGAAEFTRCASSASHHGIVPCQGGRGASASPCISIHLSLYIGVSLSISLDLSTIMHFPDPRCSEAAPHDSAPPPPPPAPAESG